MLVSLLWALTHGFTSIGTRCGVKIASPCFSDSKWLTKIVYGQHCQQWGNLTVVETILVRWFIAIQSRVTISITDISKPPHRIRCPWESYFSKQRQRICSMTLHYRPISLSLTLSPTHNMVSVMLSKVFPFFMFSVSVVREVGLYRSALTFLNS